MATVITSSPPDLYKLQTTALSADEASSQLVLSVENGLSFANNDLVVINGYGNSNSEIRQVSGAPTAGTITVSSVLSFNHTMGEPITKTFYDQLNIAYSEDLETNWETNNYSTLSAASAASTWVNLATIDLQISQEATAYQDISANRRAYKTRFYNSFTGLYSSYSDPILPDGFETQSVGDIINSALSEIKAVIGQESSSEINRNLLINLFNRAVSTVHRHRKRWSWNQVFDYRLSEITAGKNKYRLPFDMDVDYTKKSTYNCSINDNTSLVYLDKREYDTQTKDVHNTTLAAQLTTISATATLTDSSDFPDSGSFMVITGTTQDVVSYTANNRTTNVLTLAATTGVTITHSVNTDVWDNANFSDNPSYYTIWQKDLYIYPVPDTGLYQRNILIDYYKKLIKIDSFGDYILFPDPQIIIDFLCWKISMVRNEYDEADRYQTQFQEGLKQLEKNETIGQKNKFLFLINRGGYGFTQETSNKNIPNKD